MEGLEEIDKYITRTGQERSDITGGVSGYGYKKVIELVREAEKNKTKLVFFYENNEAMKSDKLSYKFE